MIKRALACSRRSSARASSDYLASMTRPDRLRGATDSAFLVCALRRAQCALAACGWLRLLRVCSLPVFGSSVPIPIVSTRNWGLPCRLTAAYRYNLRHISTATASASMSSQVVCTAKLARPVPTMPVDAASGMAQCPPDRMATPIMPQALPICAGAVFASENDTSPPAPSGCV